MSCGDKCKCCECKAKKKAKRKGKGGAKKGKAKTGATHTVSINLLQRPPTAPPVTATVTGHPSLLPEGHIGADGGGIKMAVTAPRPTGKGKTDRVIDAVTTRHEADRRVEEAMRRAWATPSAPTDRPSSDSAPSSFTDRSTGTTPSGPLSEVGSYIRNIGGRQRDRERILQETRDIVRERDLATGRRGAGASMTDTEVVRAAQGLSSGGENSRRFRGSSHSDGVAGQVEREAHSPIMIGIPNLRRASPQLARPRGAAHHLLSGDSAHGLITHARMDGHTL